MQDVAMKPFVSLFAAALTISGAAVAAPSSIQAFDAPEITVENTSSLSAALVSALSLGEQSAPSGCNSFLNATPCAPIQAEQLTQSALVAPAPISFTPVFDAPDEVEGERTSFALTQSTLFVFDGEPALDPVVMDALSIIGVENVAQNESAPALSTPLPAAAPVLLSGLAGLFWISRRRGA
ncbi:MAG: hypothetical protein AAGJ87_16140 [Pseudomonadota bacterium]